MDVTDDLRGTDDKGYDLISSAVERGQCCPTRVKSSERLGELTRKLGLCLAAALALASSSPSAHPYLPSWNLRILRMCGTC